MSYLTTSRTRKLLKYMLFHGCTTYNRAVQSSKYAIDLKNALFFLNAGLHSLPSGEILLWVMSREILLILSFGRAGT